MDDVVRMEELHSAEKLKHERLHLGFAKGIFEGLHQRTQIVFAVLQNNVDRVAAVAGSDVDHVNEVRMMPARAENRYFPNSCNREAVGLFVVHNDPFERVGHLPMAIDGFVDCPVGTNTDLANFLELIYRPTSPKKWGFPFFVRDSLTHLSR